MCSESNQFDYGIAIQVFYDGECPLCRREVDMLHRKDRGHEIRFTDIAAPEFQGSNYGLSHDALMAEIHGRLPDGSWVRGIEVFRQMYTAIGWGVVVRITRLPIVSSLLDGAYRLFARNRLRITGRCANAAACRLG